MWNMSGFGAGPVSAGKASNTTATPAAAQAPSSNTSQPPASLPRDTVTLGDAVAQRMVKAAQKLSDNARDQAGWGGVQSAVAYAQGSATLYRQAANSAATDGQRLKVAHAAADAAYNISGDGNQSIEVDNGARVRNVLWGNQAADVTANAAAYAYQVAIDAATDKKTLEKIAGDASDESYSLTGVGDPNAAAILAPVAAQAQVRAANFS